MNFRQLLNKPKLKFVIEIFGLIIGASIFSLGIAVFITPGNISVGGFTGIAIILNKLFSTPVGTFVLILNIPMFIICARIFGIKFIVKTIIGVALTSVLLDVFAFIPPIIENDGIVCALFGGVLEGLGLGILYLSGFTTGGTDLVIWLLKLKFPQLTTGVIFFAFDSIVVVISAIIFNDVQSVVYSAIAIFSYTKVLDVVLGSSERANLALIISTEYEKVADSLVNQLGRGLTVFDGKGWYTKEDKNIIMCVVDRMQISTLKRLIAEADPKAFVILTDAREVIGLGFKDMLKKKEKKKKNALRA